MLLEELIGWRPYKTMFLGQEVNMMMRPLTSKEILSLSYSKDENETLQKGLDIIPSAVKDIQYGNEKLTTEMLIEAGPLMGLCTDIFKQLTVISKIGQEQERD